MFAPIMVNIMTILHQVCPMTNGENGDTEVFLSICQQCTNEVAMTPLTPQSYSDTCPLGLQFKKSNESLSASSSTSKNIGTKKKVSLPILVVTTNKLLIY